jgi:ribosome-associated protein
VELAVMPLIVNDRIQIPDEELSFTYARSGGPGGQNVNKVSSKAVLRWNLAASPSVPAEVKARLAALQRRRTTTEGELVLTGQRYRDQERNREDCLEKLREMILHAAAVPKARRATRPTKGSKTRRLAAKRQNAEVKAGRKPPHGDE